MDRKKLRWTTLAMGAVICLLAGAFLLAPALGMDLQKNADSMARWMDDHNSPTVYGTITEDRGQENGGYNHLYVIKHEREFGGSEPVERFFAHCNGSARAIGWQDGFINELKVGQRVEISRRSSELTITAVLCAERKDVTFRTDN
jgi:hypothetical protein